MKVRRPNDTGIAGLLSRHFEATRGVTVNQAEPGCVLQRIAQHCAGALDRLRRKPRIHHPVNHLLGVLVHETVHSKG